MISRRNRLKNLISFFAGENRQIFSVYPEQANLNWKLHKIDFKSKSSV